MSDFAIPTNIKQIGTIGDGLRIYMEDYVCTYLYQFAESGGYDERVALLVGKFMVIDSQPVLFINGAVQGKYAEEKSGLLYFTEKTDVYVNAMMAEFFSGMEVVGWMQSQPSYGIYLNQHYAAYHQRIFTQAHQVMFVMDPLERINTFYAWNDDRSGLTEVKGYFIYYEKNRGMHEYMLRNKTNDYKTQPPAFVEVSRMERVEDEETETAREKRSGGGRETRSDPRNIYSIYGAAAGHGSPDGTGSTGSTGGGDTGGIDSPGSIGGTGRLGSIGRTGGIGGIGSISSLGSPAGDKNDNGHLDNPEDIIRRHQAERTRRRSHHEQRRTMNLLVSLSAVLFVVCFVMGAGLIQNQDRLAKMENQLSQLSTAYRNLFVQLSGDNAESVFAAQFESDPVLGNDPTMDNAAGINPANGTENGDPSKGIMTDPSADAQPAQSGAGQIIEENGQAVNTENNGVVNTGANSSANTDANGAYNTNNASGTSGTTGTSGTEGGSGANNAEATAPNAATSPNTQDAANTTNASNVANTANASNAASTASTANAMVVPETYTIQPGDSLLAISIRFYGENTRVNDILVINGIDNADHIVAGKTIVLPRP